MKKNTLKRTLSSLTFLLFSTIFLQNLSAQSFSRANDWKKYRKEVIIQAGVSEFLGDLGGRNEIGKDYSPVDMEFSLTRPAVSLAYRYKFAKNFNVHSSFNYLLVAGDDKLTTETFRSNRNLNFKSNIFELAVRAEVSIFSKKTGHRYGIKKTLSRRHKNRTWELIGFVGVGGFYFNPKGRNPVTGQYIALRPLNTEGQGLPGGPSKYSNFSLSIPMGVAWRMILNKYWNVGVELNYRKTFTDYIDDVSTKYYYDRPAQLQAYGATSVLMADPSLGEIPGATANNADGTGAQRGDKQKDSYMSVQITVGRFFPPKRSKSKLRSKF